MAVLDFQNFSDGTNTYRVKDAIGRGNLTTHEGALISNGGIHGIRYANGVLAYKDPTSGDWSTIKTSSVIALTQAEYDALSSDEKNKDILYVITDAYLTPYDESQITSLEDRMDDAEELLGSTSISTIGDGSVTGAISALKTADSGLDSRITELENSSGDEPVAKTTVFNANGSITETSDDKVVTTVFNSDGSITDTIQYKESGVVVKTIEKTTTFNANGSISETVEEVN